MANKLASPTWGLITEVPMGAKNEDYIKSFIKEFPDFSGKIVLYKNTQYFEDNGEVYQRQYGYEVDKGRYRKESYLDTPWKVAVDPEEERFLTGLKKMIRAANKAAERQNYQHGQIELGAIERVMDAQSIESVPPGVERVIGAYYERMTGRKASY